MQGSSNANVAVFSEEIGGISFFFLWLSACIPQLRRIYAFLGFFQELSECSGDFDMRNFYASLYLLCGT